MSVHFIFLLNVTHQLIWSALHSCHYCLAFFSNKLDNKFIIQWNNVTGSFEIRIYINTTRFIIRFTWFSIPGNKWLLYEIVFFFLKMIMSFQGSVAAVLVFLPASIAHKRCGPVFTCCQFVMNMSASSHLSSQSVFSLPWKIQTDLIVHKLDPGGSCHSDLCSGLKCANCLARTGDKSNRTLSFNHPLPAHPVQRQGRISKEQTCVCSSFTASQWNLSRLHV